MRGINTEEISPDNSFGWYRSIYKLFPIYYRTNLKIYWINSREKSRTVIFLQFYKMNIVLTPHKIDSSPCITIR